MAVRSQFNNRLSPLAGYGRPNDTFTGQPEATTGANALNIAIYTDQLTFLTIEQSPDKGNYYIHEQHSIEPNQQYNIQVPCVLGFFRVTISNQSEPGQTYMYMITSLIQAFSPESNNQPISGTVDVANFPAIQAVSGTVDVGNFPATQPVSGTVDVANFPAIQDVSGTVDVGNFPAVQEVNGTIDVGNFPATQPVSGTVDVANFPAIQPVSGTVDVANFPATQPVSGTVDVANFPAVQLVSGENSNFTFYPSAENNTVAIYADGTQGVDVTGGWQYANLATGKINWYIYTSVTPATDYKVSDLTSMYTVINQQSTLGLALAQNPWMMVYTRPDSGVNSAGWYKSKLFFGSNAHTDVLGLKLLYTGTDPVGIHPEITGINRIQLQFNSALSNGKQLIDVQNESVMLGTLQTTNNTAVVDSFSFTMQEFGIDWLKEPAVLPIEFGKVQVQDVLSEASLSSIDSKIIGCNTDAVNITNPLPAGTNTIGAVTLKALNGGDFVNLACDDEARLLTSANFQVYSNIVPGYVQLNSVPNSEANNCLCVSDLAATNLEINANKSSYVETLSPQVFTAGYGLTLDMDVNQNRMRNATIMLKVDKTTYTNPSVMFGYSEDEVNFLFDGNFAAFYDIGGNLSTCVLQRIAVPSRYIRIYFNTDTEVLVGYITLQKA